MNLRLPVFCLALLSVAATGNPCDMGSSTGTGTSTSVGPNDAVCGGNGVVTCCVAVNDPCSDNNDCCGGNCSGSPGGDSATGEGAFGDAGNTCAEPANQECTTALGSRCNTGQCECSSDNDCCLGVCQPTIIPGAKGSRCCLTTGNPCDTNGDCCSLTCQDNGQCE
jgi:hypothetical protein